MKRIAIDGMIFIYQFLIKVKYGDRSLQNADGNVTSHLQGFLYRTIRMIEQDYLPIYVFDGQRHPLKHCKPFSVEFKSTYIDSTLELLHLMGVPTVRAQFDGEAQCALMSSLVEFVSTKDIDDAFAFGSKFVGGDDLRPARDEISIITGTKPITILDFPRWLDRCHLPANWTREQYVDYRILMGNDYNAKLLPPHIGTPRAVKLLAETRLEDSEYWNDNLAAVKAYLLHPPATPVFEASLKLSAPDAVGIKHFLAKESFDPKRVEKATDRLYIATKTAKSTKTLDRWMK